MDREGKNNGAKYEIEQIAGMRITGAFSRQAVRMEETAQPQLEEEQKTRRNEVEDEVEMKMQTRARPGDGH